MSDNIESVSYSDCPYGCSNGKIFNPYTRVSVPCPYCSSKRESVISNEEKDIKTGKTLADTLKMPSTLVGSNYSIDVVLPGDAKTRLVPSSIESVDTVMQSLLDNITLGVQPDYSYMFNLGIKANIGGFVYPYMMRAYKAGLKVAPFVYAVELVRLRLSWEENLLMKKETEWGSSFTDYIDADVCVVGIDAGASVLDLLAVRGLMELRAHKNKVTIIMTLQWSSNVTAMCTEDRVKYLAHLVSVEYTGRGTTNNAKRPASNTANMPVMTEKQFSDMFSNKNIL